MSHATYKFRFYPTTEQDVQLRQQVGSCRWLWNKMLELNVKTYDETGKFMFCNEMQSMICVLKSEYNWLKNCNSQTLQVVVQTLDQTLKLFFKKKDQGYGFPQFKAKHFSSKSFVVLQHYSHLD